jgi:hypothetical protein
MIATCLRLVSTIAWRNPSSRAQLKVSFSIRFFP